MTVCPTLSAACDVYTNHLTQLYVLPASLLYIH